MPSTTRHEKILDILSRVAYDNGNAGGAKCAAAIVLRNNIISVGWNQYKTHPFQARFSKNDDAIYLHAETDAIRKALNHLSLLELSNSTLYICRVTADREWALCKPCLGCARAITQFGIKRVYYSSGTESVYEEL